MKKFDGIYEIWPPDMARPPLQATWLVVNPLSWRVLASCTSEEAARAAIRLARAGRGR